MAVRIYQQQPDSLEQLASKINFAHERIAVQLRRSWEEGKIVGQWLNDAKSRVKHTEWKKWVADNLVIPLRTCQRYMKSVKEEKEKPFCYRPSFGEALANGKYGTYADAFDPSQSELRQCWQTRKKDFNKFDSVFGFSIDACASKANSLLPRYWDKKTDCLKQDWTQEIAYCNPPFSRPAKFVIKASTAKSALVVLPIIALTCKYIANNPPKVVLIPSYRLVFDAPAGLETEKKSRSTFGVVLLVYGKVPDNLDRLGFMVATVKPSPSGVSATVTR